MKNYYQIKHTTKKHSPTEIMNNVNDEKLLDDVRENTKKIKKTFKKWEHYLLKREENTYQQLDKDRRQELLKSIHLLIPQSKANLLLNRVGS